VVGNNVPQLAFLTTGQATFACPCLGKIGMHKQKLARRRRRKLPKEFPPQNSQLTNNWFPQLIDNIVDESQRGSQVGGGG